MSSTHSGSWSDSADTACSVESGCTRSPGKGDRIPVGYRRQDGLSVSGGPELLVLITESLDLPLVLAHLDLTELLCKVCVLVAE